MPRWQVPLWNVGITTKDYEDKKAGRLIRPGKTMKPERGGPPPMLTCNIRQNPRAFVQNLYRFFNFSLFLLSIKRHTPPVASF
jgi:hypothetical protein